jgi:hypothetical protein
MAPPARFSKQEAGRRLFNGFFKAAGLRRNSRPGLKKFYTA